jgi:Rrf2 family transcriptional regulator, cysteine metabolism repressor
MKLSTKGRYAVRAMVDLAMNQDGSPVLLRDIAHRQDLSERYLEHLMLALKNTGFVRSSRGANGGYTLAREPVDISILEILRATVGDLCLVECVHDPDFCSRTPTCAVRDVWVEVCDVAGAILGRTSLENLADCQRAKDASEPAMYYI